MKCLETGAWVAIEQLLLSVNTNQVGTQLKTPRVL